MLHYSASELQISLVSRDNELPELMDGKYMGIGLTKSVKVLEGDSGKGNSAFVVTDGMVATLCAWSPSTYMAIFQRRFSYERSIPRG